jgi:hypothetical protein
MRKFLEDLRDGKQPEVIPPPLEQPPLCELGKIEKDGVIVLYPDGRVQIYGFIFRCTEREATEIVAQRVLRAAGKLVRFS